MPRRYLGDLRVWQYAYGSTCRGVCVEEYVCVEK